MTAIERRHLSSFVSSGRAGQPRPTHRQRRARFHRDHAVFRADVPERHIAFEDLTLHSRGGERLLTRLTLAVTTGTRLLVTGTDEARRALFRAMALGRDASGGRIVMPGADAIGFLPERPHVPPGTWRELLVAADRGHDVGDERVWAVLAELGLETTSQRLGGLDVERDWSHALSLGEQQLLTVACLVLAAPAFAVLQSPATTLAPEQLARALAALFRAGVSYLVLGGATAPNDAYDAVLEIHGDGAWSYRRGGPATSDAQSSRR